MKLSDERVAIEHAQAIIKNLDQARLFLCYVLSLHVNMMDADISLTRVWTPTSAHRVDGRRVPGQVHGVGGCVRAVQAGA